MSTCNIYIDTNTLDTFFLSIVQLKSRILSYLGLTEVDLAGRVDICARRCSSSSRKPRFRLLENAGGGRLII